MKKKTGSAKPRKVKSNGLSGMQMLFGLGCVFFTVLVMFFFKVNVQKNEVRASLSDGDFLEIDVPSRAITKGEKLSEVPFSKLKWPAQSDLGRYMKSVSAYQSHYAAINLPAFTPVSIDALSQSYTDANAVVENIPLGFRAITVKVDVESVVEGWAQTGNYVDVIVLKQSSDPEMGVEAKLIAENVKILSSGASAELTQKSKSTASSPPATVTLLVSQEDALKIRTAATVGKLTFALRGVGDQSPSTTLSMNQKLLLGGPKTAGAQKVEKRGVAKGPDGKMYVLDGNAEWVRELKVQ